MKMYVKKVFCFEQNISAPAQKSGPHLSFIQSRALIIALIKDKSCCLALIMGGGRASATDREEAGLQYHSALP